MSQRNSHRLGMWAALAACAASTGYGVVQTMQILGITKPPLDAILIFGVSICIATPFVIAMVALLYAVPAEKRVWTHAGIAFAGMYATLVSLVYMTELFVTIPAQLQGAADKVQFVTLSEHSFFWAVDALGYIFMSFATLLAAGAFAWRGLQGWLKLFFVAHGVQAPLIVLILVRPDLLLIGSPWIVTAPVSMLLLAIFFARGTPAPIAVTSQTPQ